jgi:iron(III) transport system permease protein
MSRFFFGRNSHAMMAKATSQGGPRKAGRLVSWLCTSLFLIVTFLAILPHIGVVMVAFFFLVLSDASILLYVICNSLRIAN